MWAWMLGVTDAYEWGVIFILLVGHIGVWVSKTYRGVFVFECIMLETARRDWIVYKHGLTDFLFRLAIPFIPIVGLLLIDMVFAFVVGVFFCVIELGCRVYYFRAYPMHEETPWIPVDTDKLRKELTRKEVIEFPE